MYPLLSLPKAMIDDLKSQLSDFSARQKEFETTPRLSWCLDEQIIDCIKNYGLNTVFSKQTLVCCCWWLWER